MNCEVVSYSIDRLTNVAASIFMLILIRMVGQFINYLDERYSDGDAAKEPKA